MIETVRNEMEKKECKELGVMSLDNVKRAHAFHKSFPMYEETPLAELDNFARLHGLGGVFVKDESYRFGLNAFKVLGGSFAMANYIAEKVGRDIADVTYDYLTSERLKKEFGQATFFTATDGNHGRGVAWAANKLGQKSVVHMPKGSQKIRLDNILKENAVATIEDVNYDECVRIANREANETENGVMVQDTAWEGYEKIPSWIMQGYGTMAMEADEQLGRRPTHIFIQAGVGSLAGAVQGYFANRYPDDCPTTVVVEPNEAACVYKSAKAGKIQFVEGDMPTIMAGLACGEPNTISWQILKNKSAFFASVPDWVSAKGMRTLGCPVKGDRQVVSGESGAVTMGFLAAITEREEYRHIKEEIGLDENSVVLLFSTEGDTDPENYRRIVWDGAYNSEEK